MIEIARAGLAFGSGRRVYGEYVPVARVGLPERTDAQIDRGPGAADSGDMKAPTGASQPDAAEQIRLPTTRADSAERESASRRNAWGDDGTCGRCGHRVLESQLAPVLLEILCGGTGLALWRNATGYDDARRIRYGLSPGSGDYVGLYAGRYVEIETKTVRGRLSAAQHQRQALIQRLGGVYAVVRSEADARALLAQLQSGAV